MEQPDSENDGLSPDEALVLPLGRLGRGDLAVAGGKGANLGELVRAGFPVPEGYVITTAAYDRFVAGSHLIPTAGGAEGGAVGGEEGHAADIQQAFERTPMPREVAQAILAAYQRLGQGAVAVRSSATTEDLPEAAFAGQQDTYLNVIGDERLLDAVRRCWASLWNERAVAYRTRQGLLHQAPRLAVVVQRMVAADVAGVMFTADPVIGTRDVVVVDASAGLGEAVVSGAVTPDHFVLDRRGRKKEWRPGKREVIVRAQAGGGTEQVAGEAQANHPVLTKRALRRLVQLGLAIESHFGQPQDIEWAVQGGGVFIVQARPITALPEPPLRPSRAQQMLAGMFAEMFPVRPYPLDMSTWVPALSDAAVGPLFSLIGLSAPSLAQRVIEEDGVAVRLSEEVGVHLTPAVILAPARLLWQAARYDPLRWGSDPLVADARQRARALGEGALVELPWPALLLLVRETLELILPLAGEPRRRYYPRALFAAGLLRASLGLLGQGRNFGVLLSAGIESATVDANRALEALADRVRSCPTLVDIFGTREAGDLQPALAEQPAGRAFLEAFSAFLERYGHREIVLSTVLQPTWKDAPEVVLGLVKGLAASQAPPEVGRPAWEAARAEALAHPLFRLAALRSAFQVQLATARSLWQIREDTHFDATLILPGLRRTLLELGRRLERADVLDAPEDVFHLKLDELALVDSTWPPAADMARELRAVVLRRKVRRAALEALPFVDPRLFRQPWSDQDDEGDLLLRGAPGSPGQAEGPVRVIREASEFGLLRSGEVLVAPYTNPAWTPLFQRAAAVVVDGGGAGSHAAIVAREYGVPAVMATVDGTQRLTDGEWVRVDGARGLVFGGRAPGS